MSEEGSFWIGLAEKFFGLILVIVSIILIYFTATSLDTLSAYTGLFAFLGVIVLIAGAFMIVVKPPE
jgi:hypothetical protein